MSPRSSAHGPPARSHARCTGHRADESDPLEVSRDSRGRAAPRRRPQTAVMRALAPTPTHAQHRADARATSSRWRCCRIRLPQSRRKAASRRARGGRSLPQERVYAVPQKDRLPGLTQWADIHRQHRAASPLEVATTPEEPPPCAARVRGSKTMLGRASAAARGGGQRVERRRQAAVTLIRWWFDDIMPSKMQTARCSMQLVSVGRRARVGMGSLLDPLAKIGSMVMVSAAWQTDSSDGRVQPGPLGRAGAAACSN